MAFAGAGQRSRVFGVLQVLTVKWATGDLPEECQFFLDTQLVFFCKNEKEPATLLFDDDKLIRSLTEAETITAVSQKCDPSRWKRTRSQNMSRQFFALSAGEIAAIWTTMTSRSGLARSR